MKDNHICFMIFYKVSDEKWIIPEYDGRGKGWEQRTFYHHQDITTQPHHPPHPACSDCITRSVVICSDVQFIIPLHYWKLLQEEGR